MVVRTSYMINYGTPSELAEPTLEERNLIISPDNFERGLEGFLGKVKSFFEAFERGSGLIVPKFFGVYQVSLVEGVGSSEILEKEIEETIYAQTLIEQAGAISPIGMINREEKIRPRRVHLIYENGWNDMLTRGSFQKCPSRIKLSDIKEVPNFYRKDPTTSTIILERIKEAIESRERPKDTLKVIAPNVARLGDDRKDYGLTLAEDNLYQSFSALLESI